MQLGNGAFWLGDCLDLLASVPDGSVDMVLCDLPYGTTACKWDVVIPFEKLWLHYWRICKPNAAVVLTASQPFTSALVMSQVEWFRHSWIWNKKSAANVMSAKYGPLKIHEDVCIFSRQSGAYNPQMVTGKLKMKGGNAKSGDILGNVKPSGTYFSDQYYPKTIIEFTNNNNIKKQHPTQKPVALFDYLIRTYTNPGDLVLDNCAGSGTTAVAAQASDRRWLCMERDPSYYYAAVGRVWSALNVE